MKDLKYFCSHLFTSLSFDHMGQVRVCCNNYEVPTGENLEPINVYSEDFNVNDAFNSDLHVRIRQNILENKQDESCHRCWQTEENGAESYFTWEPKSGSFVPNEPITVEADGLPWE